MSVWRDLRDVLEMYTSGGLVILTGLDGSLQETAVSPPSPDNKPIGIRTTIQLNSNYITTVAPAMLQQPQIWQDHITQINTKLAVLDKLRILAQQSWVLFLLFPLAWFGYELTTITSWEDAWQLIYPTIMSAVIVLARKWLLRLLQKTIFPLLTKGIGWFVKRRFEQFVGDM